VCHWRLVRQCDSRQHWQQAANATHHGTSHRAPATLTRVISIGIVSIRHSPDDPCLNDRSCIIPIQPPDSRTSVSDPARFASVLAFRRLVSLVRGHGIDRSGHFRAYLNCRLPCILMLIDGMMLLIRTEREPCQPSAVSWQGCPETSVAEWLPPPSERSRIEHAARSSPRS